jgi:hypothetical protein
MGPRDKGIPDMSHAADQLTSFANAERQLCEQAGPLVARIIQELENRYQLKIREIRISINPSEISRSWGGINCVITQADVAPWRRTNGSSDVADNV